MKQRKFGLYQMTASVVLVMAAMVASHSVHAGAGWGVSTDATGAPIKVPTYHANSPSGLREDLSPTAAPGALINSGAPLRKFVDGLPGLDAAGANNLGQYIPVAVADTTSYPGSDYYEIGIVEYTERMHSDLPKATTLRGYVQLETPSNAAFSKHIALTYPNGTPIVDAKGNQIFAMDNPHYLGPMISANRGVPVRLKYSNLLPTGHYDPAANSRNGDLFLPVDETLMGAGFGPDGINKYTQNRATIHLHGADSPWISDGTPHQWITPAGENTPYKTGASFQNVPDMPDPGPGSGTMYYPNNQSARMMFYHDHTAGITRLNVYAGEAAGYLISDPVEQGLITSRAIPAVQIPLIIQDKSFVPADIIAQDAKWDVNHWGQPGDLWFSHVYETNQDPNSFDGTNPVGRWDYGPWFWPVFPAPLALPTGEYGNASIVPEAFMDTALVNGTAYPVFTVQPQAYRFRILNAANDRSINLGLYESEPLSVVIMNGGTGYSATPIVSIAPAPGDLTGNGATATATVTGGIITGITVTNPGSGYTAAPIVTITDATGVGAAALAAVGTEVKMVPAAPGNASWPATWPTDGRAGGVPDPVTAGPDIIQIGSEGGFLPAPAVIPSTPVGFEYNRRSATVLGILSHGLYLAPAERADTVIDFSGYCPGTKLILFNDAPAPVPGFDPRADYYTGNPDLTSVGGAPSTKPGYGPNTRTVMQFVVAGAPVPGCVHAAFTKDPNPNVKNPTLTALQASLPGAYAASQPKPVVGEAAYSGLWTTNFTNTYASIHTGSLRQPNFTFTNGDGVLQTLPVQNKAIQELFDPNYGRMNATLGVEMPFTSAFNQTTIPLGYVDPITETISDGETQIWKITHNGIDTHPVHFHLVNVQLINRVGWDGTVKPPADNELGWKETVKMNPLEDVIVAVRAKAPVTPFGQPDSVRALDPTQPLGVTTGFSQVNPATGFPATISNVVANFGWEYVWHCHILGHEENDFMRPIVFKYTAIAPSAPSNLTLNGNVLSWTDTTPKMSATTMGDQQNEIGFRIERSTNYGTFAAIGTVQANATSFTDTTALSPNTDYSYRVIAYNASGNSPASNIVTLAQQQGSLSPASLTFLPQSIGTMSLAQTLTLTNAAVTPMKINSVSLGGVNQTDFIQTNNCVAGDLTTGASCTISVQFSPSASGTSLAVLTVNTSSGQQTAALIGGSQAPSVSMTPTTPITFNAQQVGTSGASQVVTLTNTGNDVLPVSGILLNGGNAADFAQTNTCGNGIAVGMNCTISVTFTPSLVSNETTTLTVGTAAGTKSLSLNGLGVSPAAATVPTAPLPMAFAAQQLGTISAPKTATLTNTGIGPLLITNISITGLNPVDFAQTSTCPLSANGASLPMGASCTVDVTFKPAATTPRSAILNFATSAGLKTIALSGGGQLPSASLSPSTPLAFGIQEVTLASAAQVATLANTGVGPLSYTTIAISGTDAADFSQTSNCANGLAAGANCAINVTFKPGTVGIKSALLSVVNAAGTQTVALSGNSRPAYAANLSSTALSYVPQQTASASAAQAVTLTNTGARPLPITSVAIGGADAADFSQTNTCGASVAVNSSCSFNVAFAPTVAGAKSATLTVADPAGTQTIALNGSSQAPSSSMMPNTPLLFVAQQVGTAASAPQTVRLTNTGIGPLAINSIVIGGANAADFAETHTCGASLAVGASCTMDVTFTPGAPGVRSATLTVSDAGATQVVALSGDGASPLSTLMPNTLLTFAPMQSGSVASIAQTVTLSNKGIGPLAINSITIGGVDAAEFAQTNTCGTSLAVGANCTIDVTYKPGAAGAKSATLVVSDGGGNQTLALNATSVAQSSTLTPGTALNFAPQQVAAAGQVVPLGLQQAGVTQTVMLANTGIDVLSISSIGIGGVDAAEFSQTNNCGASLAAGANCTISVTFTAGAAGAKSAALTVVDAAGTHTLNLSGSAQVPSSSLTPATLQAFGALQVGISSAAQTLTLANTGVGALSISGISIGGTNAAGFAQTNNCGTSLAAGTSCAIGVTFTPDVAGAETAVLTVADAAGTQAVALSGDGAAASSTLLPNTPLAFTPVQLVGTASAAQTVTLSNTGIGPLAISGISTVGVDAADFVQTSTCGTGLAVGGSCTVSVAFKPAVSGIKSATLNVVSAGGTHAIALSGEAAAPMSALTPNTPVIFAAQQVGTVSAAQQVTLSNTGVFPLPITGIRIGGANTFHFAQTNNCGTSLAVGASCMIDVVSKPSTPGGKSATLEVVDAAGTKSLALSGTGAAPSFTLSTTQPFTAQQTGTSSAAQTVTLSNTGVGPLAIKSIAIGGANAADFVQTNACSLNLAAGTSCAINVTFKPGAPGARSATLTVTDASGVKSVALSGGGAVPSSSLTPNVPIVFAAQQVGTASLPQTVTLSNTGVGLLTISSIKLGGTNPFQFMLTNNCGATLAAGASCTVDVVSKPSTLGGKAATLIVTDASGTKTLALSGSGQAAFVATLSSKALAFAVQQTGTASAPQRVTLTNAGGLPLSITGISLGGANAADFVQTNNCGTSLAVSASCAMDVSSKPVTAGGKSATLSVGTASGAMTVALSGSGADPMSTLTPNAPLAFAPQQIGTTSAAQVVTLANAGQTPLAVGSIKIGGANVFHFAQANNCGASLAVGASCAIGVVSKPTTLGGKTATLIVTDAAGTRSIALSGSGQAALASTLSATSLSYAVQQTGTASALQTVTLSNTGAQPLAINSIVIGGANAADFAQSNTCGGSVAAGSSCSIGVTFTPTVSGAESATLTVTDAAGSKTVALSGTGAVISSALTPNTPIVFAAQPVGIASTAQPVTLTNTGGLPLAISSIKIGGANVFHFAQTNNCKASLAVGASCTINVASKPGTPGGKSATLVVVDAAGTQSVALSGTGQ